MSTTRLLALSLLDGEGPMHGHQIRRRVEVIDASDWGEISIGGLYAALHRLETEGLIQPVRHEQDGNFPARTVYAITDEGRQELSNLRHRALSEAQLRADPVDVALAAAAGFPETTLRVFLQERRRAVEARLAGYQSERARLEANGYLRPATVAIFQHLELRMEAELRWHAELDGLLPAIAAGARNPGSMAKAAATPAEGR